MTTAVATARTPNPLTEEESQYMVKHFPTALEQARFKQFSPEKRRQIMDYFTEQDFKEFFKEGMTPANQEDLIRFAVDRGKNNKKDRDKIKTETDNIQPGANLISNDNSTDRLAVRILLSVFVKEIYGLETKGSLLFYEEMIQKLKEYHQRQRTKYLSPFTALLGSQSQIVERKAITTIYDANLFTFASNWTVPDDSSQIQAYVKLMAIEYGRVIFKFTVEDNDVSVIQKLQTKREQVIVKTMEVISQLTGLSQNEVRMSVEKNFVKILAEIKIEVLALT